MKLFLGKFDQLDSTWSPMDSNGNYPLRVCVISGEAKAIIMNGTIFRKNDLKTQKVYLCMNYVDLVGRNQIKVIEPVYPHELKEWVKLFGEDIYSLSEEDEDIRMYRRDCKHVGDDSLEWNRDALSE